MQAVKRAEVEPFAVSPQQSDYAHAWTAARGAALAGLPFLYACLATAPPGEGGTRNNFV